MDNKALVKKYMRTNRILLSNLDIVERTINVFDGQGNTVFSYADFFDFIAAVYDLVPNFTEKSIVVLDNLDCNEDVVEINYEYTKNSGKPTSFLWKIIKLTDKDFLLTVQELTETNFNQLDQMTQANPKEYIENRAKNCLLTKTPYTLIYFDIDNFKGINDEYGQAIGDMILIELVSTCKNILGNKGGIARVGGDRFLIIYEIDNDYDVVHEFLFNLKIGLQQLASAASRGALITLTLGSVRCPLDGDNYELLLKKCQKALIRGKNKGRDCFIMYLEEKCGKVTLEDVIEEKIKKIDNISAKNNIYSMITDVNELLSRENDFDESLTKAISIVGNYFYLDRISIGRIDIINKMVTKTHYYYYPKTTIKHEAHIDKTQIYLIENSLGNKNYIKFDDIKELPDNDMLKMALSNDNTTSTITFGLSVNGKLFGVVRYDMTTGARQWQTEVFQILMLISQIISSYIQKNYLKEVSYETVYLDAKYKCYNFSKMFNDASQYILNNEIKQYSILEFDIRKIINYRSVIGMEKMNELVRLIIDSLYEVDPTIIYGKKNDGAFVVFYKHNNKEIIEKTFELVCKNVDEFVKKYHINELKFQSGAYLANIDKNDKLINSISNATLTRSLNKTNDLLFYSEEIKNNALLKNEMILRIDEALEKNEFLLYLQPKISTSDKKLMGAEALTRWHYKFEKLMFPDQFIPLFEQQGIIEKLDFRVFENVCIYQKKLLDENKLAVPISVNVSRYVSNFDDYVDKIESIRNKYNIPSSLIEIEITEGMYYEKSYVMLGFMKRLHEIGYKISMDDFGSGYSNLVSLAKLNFDVIKFDKSFCMDLENENVRLMMLKLIDLVKTLKMKTVCEGVETKENVEYLTEIGCDSIQGYYYSKPIPYKEFEEKYYNN